jgi:hypothetical protein
LIQKLFGNNIIQNPPNSPDLAYPIENIWGYKKPRIKRRAPKSLKELKKFVIEEWNSIPRSIIKKTGLNYSKRLEKNIQIDGVGLEQCHLRQIRKDLANKGEEIELDEEKEESNGENEENDGENEDIKELDQKNYDFEIESLKFDGNF